MNENSGSSTAIKELTCTLHGDALLAAHEGDGERAAVDLAATLRIARQMREMPFLLAEVVSLERYREALFAWGVLLQRAPDLFTDERLRLLEQTADDFADPAITLRLTATRMTFYDAIQRLYTDDGSGDGVMCITSPRIGDDQPHRVSLLTILCAPVTSLYVAPSRRQSIKEFDRLLDLMETEAARPLWISEPWQSESQAKAYLKNPRTQLIGLMAPDLQSLHVIRENAIQQRDAIFAVSAAHRYRLKNGSWPASLNALVPDYLASIPLDRLTGKPMNYRVDADGPMLYSVGSDRKDDSGRPAMLTDEYHYDYRTQSVLRSVTFPWHWHCDDPHASRDGDLILWPAEPAEPKSSPAQEAPK